MKTRTVIIIGSSVVILTSLFAYGYLAYNRTVPVSYNEDQEKEMLLPLIVLYYGEQDTPANRDKYRYMSAAQMKSILNVSPDNTGNDSTIIQ